MVYRALVTCALVCCTLVGISFALFAVDQASTATKAQVQQLQSGSQRAGRVPAKATKPAQPRRFIDGAAGKLTSPFRSFIHTSSTWSVEIASTLLAFLLYGVGLGYLARYSRLA